MQSVLKNLHATPGIIGVLVADTEGSLLAQSFPPLFDHSALQTVCEDVRNSMIGVQDATGGVKLLDLRFEHGRVIVKQHSTFFLLLLCEQQVNFQLLLITINVALRNLEPLVMNRIAVPKSAPVAVAVPHIVKSEVSSARLNKIVESSISSGMI